MPRIPLLVAAICAAALAGCFFSADYGSGNFTCTDNVCPADFECIAGHCQRIRHDAGPPIDMMIDARLPALTCADPGAIPATGGMADGTTVGRSNTVASACGGFVFNGKDAIYKIDLTAGKMLHVDVKGGRKAYVIAACIVSPNTPACIGNTVALPGSPITVTPAAGPSFIIVDDENPANASAYMLDVTIN